MISVIGIGNAACNIAKTFSETSNYDIYYLNSAVKRNSKRKFKLKALNKPEDYENNVPNLKKFFADIEENVQVIVVGSSYSSNYTLGILEQIKDKNIEIFYIKPDL